MTCNNGFEENQPKDYKAEGDAIIEKLKTDPAFCRQFFFDTEETDEKGDEKKTPCQIAPLRSKMIFDMKKDYGVEIKPIDFSTIVYLALWSDGAWTPLATFEGRSSFYVWLRKVARNALVEWLIEEGQIAPRTKTAGNTRLVMMSQSPSLCKMAIDGLMVGSRYYRLLTAIYVDRLSKEKIMSRLDLTADGYEAAKKTGEKYLKDALLRSVEFSEEDFIREKTKHVVTVSTEVVADLSEWCTSKMGFNPLADILGTNLSDEEVRQKTVDFLYNFSEKMEWSDRDRYIWCRRFIVNADPEGLADEVGRSRAWLDTRYSRLNAKFKEAAKKWWQSHAT